MQAEATGPGDPRFFRRSVPHSAASVAEVAGAALATPSDLVLTGVAPLQIAGPDQVSFLDNRRYADALAAPRAGPAIVHPDLAARVPASSVGLVTAAPYEAWARVAALFYPPDPIKP